MRLSIFLLIALALIIGCRSNGKTTPADDKVEAKDKKATEIPPTTEVPATSEPKPSLTEKKPGEDKKLMRIFIIHSYHEEMEWIAEINKGISTALSKRVGVDVETQYFFMDTKRHTDEEWKENMGKKARDKIQEYNPRIVITCDDNATKYVASKMANTPTQFVFLGVNSAPKEYGFPVKNVTGFLEHENFGQTANLLKEIDPRLERVVFLADNSESTAGLEQRVKEEQNLISMEIVAVERIGDFETWKKAIQKYQTETDCLIFGHYHTIKDEKGETVPAPKVMEWNLLNSRIPEGSFWAFAVNEGVLCAITVSGYQHGLQAAKRCLEIIETGKQAGDYPIETIREGEQMINTARAKQLGLQIPQSTLKNSILVERQTAIEK